MSRFRVILCRGSASALHAVVSMHLPCMHLLGRRFLFTSHLRLALEGPVSILGLGTGHAGRWGPGRAVLAHLCGGDSFSLRSGERAGAGSGRTLGLS